MILYHGSNAIVRSPKILESGFYKDFGYGFYCTNIKKQAVRWALTRHGEHILNSYEYTPNHSLNILSFAEMSDEWLEFVVSCRKGDKHPYDIVEGAMADDTIWDYIEDYCSGNITKAAFWELVRFKYPTHQIVFCTDNALDTIKWTDFERL
jgi:hypothetical protein